jgi:hypothetical protein
MRRGTCSSEAAPHEIEFVSAATQEMLIDVFTEALGLVPSAAWQSRQAYFYY